MSGVMSDGERGAHPDRFNGRKKPSAPKASSLTEEEKTEIIKQLTEPLMKVVRQATLSHNPIPTPQVPLIGTSVGQYPWIPSKQVQPEPKDARWPEYLAKARAGMTPPEEWPVALPAMSDMNKGKILQVAEVRRLNLDYVNTLTKKELLDVVRGNEKLSWTSSPGASGPSVSSGTPAPQSAATSSASGNTGTRFVPRSRMIPRTKPSTEIPKNQPQNVTINIESLMVNKD